MASSTICTISFCAASSSASSLSSVKTTMYSISSCSCSSTSANSHLKTIKFPLSSRFSQMGTCNFTAWNGLKHMGISISAKPQKLGRRGKCRGKVVYASLFGVGAPEALVIGVVALLVFGPKGLAEVARNLGKTLRTFQPTIRELQDVSREFKSTLEREIGLDDVAAQTRSTYESNKANFTPNSSISSSEDSQTAPVADPNGALSNKEYSGEDYFKMREEQLFPAPSEVTSSPPESQVETDESLPQALQQDVVSTSLEPQIEPKSQTQATQQDVKSSSPENTIESESHPQAIVQETATAVPSSQKYDSETRASF